MELVTRNGHMKALMLNPDRLEEVCMDYLSQTDTPNIAGLSIALGSTPQFIRNTFLEDPAQANQTTQLIPAEEKVRRADAVHILGQAVMQIEDRLISESLVGNHNAHMTKFVLSAYHNRNEKTLTENTSDKKLTIVVESHTPIDINELKEFQRLEKAMDEQTDLELISMGRAPRRDDAQATAEDFNI